MRGLAVSLIERGKITTTAAKAKELRPFIERLVTHAKDESVAKKRLISSRLGEPKPVILKRLTEVAQKNKERAGGYTRIIKMGRTVAGRDEAVIEFI
jgi:large subunit ribosomal protein L17